MTDQPAPDTPEASALAAELKQLRLVAWNALGEQHYRLTPEHLARILTALQRTPPNAGELCPRTLDGIELLGEALFALSDKLRASHFIEEPANHAAYEKVVAAFQALDPKHDGDQA